MHTHEPFITLFLTAFECNAAWHSKDDTVSSGHAVVCGIVKKQKKVFIFVVDPNGIQIEKMKWWQKYTQILVQIQRMITPR